MNQVQISSRHKICLRKQDRVMLLHDLHTSRFTASRNPSKFFTEKVVTKPNQLPMTDKACREWGQARE
jgi:hypothetical protein